MQLRLRRRAGGALIATTLVLAACGDDDTTAADTSSSVPTVLEDETTTTIAPTSDDGSASPDTADAGRPGGLDADEDASATTGTVIEVAVAGGTVDGGGRHELELGETVTIRVTSDTADQIHVHGYDVYGDVAAGGTGEVTFTADVPGIWEVELEDAGIALLELQVS